MMGDQMRWQRRMSAAERDKVTGQQCFESMVERPACRVSAKRDKGGSLVDARSSRAPSVKLDDATQVDELDHKRKIWGRTCSVGNEKCPKYRDHMTR
jgi:hypothetical protein